MYFKKLCIKATIILSSLFISSCFFVPATPGQTKSAVNLSKMPYQSFVKILSIYSLKYCNPADPKMCIERQALATASGFLVKKAKKGGYYAATASHVCNPTSFPKLLQVKASIFALSTKHDKHYKAKVLKFNVKNDICLVHIDGLENKPVIRLSQTKPERYDAVHNIAAPHGGSMPNAIPYFFGHYLGEYVDSRVKFGPSFYIPNIKYATYAIFVRPGSSGSVLMNDKFEAVGMIVRKKARLPIALSPAYDVFKSVLSSFLKEYH